MSNPIHLFAVLAISILAVTLGCSSSNSDTMPDVTTAPSTATSEAEHVSASETEQGLTEAQIAEIVAENQRVLGSMPEPDDETEWKTITTIKCPASEDLDQSFTTESTWRIRWISGGNCVVRTTPIDAYNGWYSFGGLSESQPTTKPNKNPGTHSVNVSLCFSGCTLIVEQAAK